VGVGVLNYLAHRSFNKLERFSDTSYPIDISLMLRR